MTRIFIRALVAAAICTLPTYSLADSHAGQETGARSTDEQPTVTDSQRSMTSRAAGSSTADQAAPIEGNTAAGQPTPPKTDEQPTVTDSQRAADQAAPIEGNTAVSQPTPPKNTSGADDDEVEMDVYVAK